jgi:site-specific DNA-methyltransferase (adenine-specific)
MSDGQYAFEKSKIIQGDCLEKMKLIPDGSIDMILADLPYGVTANKWDSVIDLELLWKEYKRIIKLDGAIVLTATQPFATSLINSGKDIFKYDLVIQKPRYSRQTQAKRMPMLAHEFGLVFYKKTPCAYKPYTDEINKNGGKKPPETKTDNYKIIGQDKYVRPEYKTKNTIIPVFNIDNRGMHPTQKSTKLFEYLIKTYTNEGDIVLDNVAGSGTTGEACINLNRDFILIEKEPNYYEAIKERVGKIFKNYGLDLQPLLDERM